MQENHTEVRIYHKWYTRAPSNFNPTFDSTGVPYWYDFEKLIELKYFPESAINAEKLKFTCFNTNLVTRFIYWNEITYEYTSTNSLFFMYFAPYKWLTIDSCTLSVRTFTFMTLEGVNAQIINSQINITNTIQLTTHQSLIECDYFLPAFSGIANNYILNNNTFFGLSLEAWDQISHF
jgi:hypothetical protein